MIRLFRSRSDGQFKTRGSERDTIEDQDAIKQIADVIDNVLARAEAERAGLQRRLDDVTSRAAIVAGNDVDEFLSRSEQRVAMLRNSDEELKRARGRLDTINLNITHFKFLKTALKTRFPN